MCVCVYRCSCMRNRIEISIYRCLHRLEKTHDNSKYLGYTLAALTLINKAAYYYEHVQIVVDYIRVNAIFQRNRRITYTSLPLRSKIYAKIIHESIVVLSFTRLRFYTLSLLSSLSYKLNIRVFNQNKLRLTITRSIYFHLFDSLFQSLTPKMLYNVNWRSN